MRKLLVIAVLAVAMMAGMSFTYGEGEGNGICTYSVTVNYKDSYGNFKSMTVTVSATSPSEAQQMAKDMCENKVDNPTVVSCGVPRPVVGDCK